MLPPSLAKGGGHTAEENSCGPHQASCVLTGSMIAGQQAWDLFVLASRGLAESHSYSVASGDREPTSL